MKKTSRSVIMVDNIKIKFHWSLFFQYWGTFILLRVWKPELSPFIMGVFAEQSFRSRVATAGLNVLWRQLNPPLLYIMQKYVTYGWSLLARSVECWAACFWVLGAAKMWASRVLHDICIRYQYTAQWSIDKMLSSGCWYIVWGLYCL